MKSNNNKKRLRLLFVKYYFLLLSLLYSLSSLSHQVSSGTLITLAPRASTEEAKVVHWRQPEINREFWHIPLLTKSFISTKPEQIEDDIEVGELGERKTW